MGAPARQRSCHRPAAGGTRLLGWSPTPKKPLLGLARRVVGPVQPVRGPATLLFSRAVAGPTGPADRSFGGLVRALINKLKLQIYCRQAGMYGVIVFVGPGSSRGRTVSLLLRRKERRQGNKVRRLCRKVRQLGRKVRLFRRKVRLFRWKF